LGQRWRQHPGVAPLNTEPEIQWAGHARALALLIVALAFGLCGAALAWFGWVDAPISDGAMLLVAAGLLAGVLAAGAALLALELGLMQRSASAAAGKPAAADGGSSADAQRAWQQR
jgi:hypothetical protein